MKNGKRVLILMLMSLWWVACSQDTIPMVEPDSKQNISDNNSAPEIDMADNPPDMDVRPDMMTMADMPGIDQGDETEALFARRMSELTDEEEVAVCELFYELFEDASQRESRFAAKSNCVFQLLWGSRGLDFCESFFPGCLEAAEEGSPGGMENPEDETEPTCELERFFVPACNALVGDFYSCVQMDLVMTHDLINMTCQEFYHQEYATPDPSACVRIREDCDVDVIAVIGLFATSLYKVPHSITDQNFQGSIGGADFEFRAGRARAHESLPDYLQIELWDVEPDSPCEYSSDAPKIRFDVPENTFDHNFPLLFTVEYFYEDGAGSARSDHASQGRIRISSVEADEVSGGLHFSSEHPLEPDSEAHWADGNFTVTRCPD